MSNSFFEQRQLTALDLHAPALGVEAHVAQHDTPARVAAAPPQDAADARQKLAHVERLGKVVVGALLQTRNTVFERIARRNDDDARTPPLRLELFEDPKAAAVGKHDVQQDAVVLVKTQLQRRIPEGLGLLNDVARTAQLLAHQAAQRRLVLYDQNFHPS